MDIILEPIYESAKIFLMIGDEKKAEEYADRIVSEAMPLSQRYTYDFGERIKLLTPSSFYRCMEMAAEIYALRGNKEKAKELVANRYLGLYEAGIIYALIGNKEEAVECAREYIKEEDEKVRRYLTKEIEYEESGIELDKEFLEDLGIYEKEKVRKKKESIPYVYSWGAIYRAIAITALTNDKDKVRNYADYLYYLGEFGGAGRVYATIGDKKKARESAIKGIEIEKEDLPEIYNSGKTFAMIGDKEGAIRYIEQLEKKGFPLTFEKAGKIWMTILEEKRTFNILDIVKNLDDLAGIVGLLSFFE